MKDVLKKSGKGWNHKRIRRIYRELGLNIRRKPKKRLSVRAKMKLEQPVAIN
jgi:putative transposase